MADLTAPILLSAREHRPAGGTTAYARPGRRRQRSVRVTVAVTLLVLATAFVLVALPTQSPVWLSTAAVVALLCGWAAARIVYSELVQSRREAAADRAAQARAYQVMFAGRAAEHAALTAAMTDRLVTRDGEVARLRAGLADAERRTTVAERRAAEAEERVQRGARRLVDAQMAVQQLTERVADLEVARAERVDELATWHGGVIH
jgi:hypothetical protein